MRQHLQTPTQPTPERPLAITSIEETDVEMLPPEIVLAAVKCGELQRARGKRMLTNSEAYDEISRRLGWNVRLNENVLTN